MKLCGNQFDIGTETLVIWYQLRLLDLVLAYLIVRGINLIARFVQTLLVLILSISSRV